MDGWSQCTLPYFSFRQPWNSLEHPPSLFLIFSPHSYPSISLPLISFIPMFFFRTPFSFQSVVPQTNPMYHSSTHSSASQTSSGLACNDKIDKNRWALIQRMGKSISIKLMILRLSAYLLVITQLPITDSVKKKEYFSSIQHSWPPGMLLE